MFLQGPSISSRLAFYLAITLTILVADHRFNALGSVRQVLNYLVSPVQYIVNAPSQALAWLGDNLRSHNDLIRENQALKDEQLKVSIMLQKLWALEQENIELKALMNSSANLDDDVLIAQMLAVDLDPFRQQIVIDKGTRDGVYVGQPVIDAMGVMGQIVATGPISSNALLISDPSHAIPVKVNRNGLRTVAEGTGDPDQMNVLYVPVTADIQEGDILISSGLGGRFPANYPVATIKHIDRLPGERFARINAAPLAQLARAKQVLLIMGHRHQPQSDLNEPITSGAASSASPSDNIQDKRHD